MNWWNQHAIPKCRIGITKDNAYITPMKNERYQALLLDLDGTVVDTSRDIHQSIILTLQHYGYDSIALADSIAFIGDGVRQLVQRALGKSLHGDPDYDIDNAQLDEAERIYRQFYAEHILDTTIPYPQVPETLAKLKDKRLAVISNKTYIYTLQILEHFRLHGYFEIILGGDSLEKKKPDPMPLNYITQRFKIEKQQALMVGDSEKDIAAGQAADIPTCAVTYGMRTREELTSHHPDFCIARFADLLAIAE